METDMTWLSNCWYQVGWTDDLPAGGSFAKTILGASVLFYRGEDGQIAALLDRCPHRFVPLSAGTFKANVVTCPYHGLAFGSDGRCVNNPHGPITSTMRVRSFPVVERHTAIWFWPGDEAAADPGQIPDLSFIDQTPETARIRMDIPTACNYQLLIDNIMDLSHADYLHPTTLGGMMTDAKMRSREDGDDVVVEWTADNCVPAPGFASATSPDGKVDVWIRVRWRAPGVMILSSSIVPAGTEHNVSTTTLHNMVPETEDSTHYFMCTTRSFELENEGVTAAIQANAEQAFLREDKPMLELQRQGMAGEDFWDLKPVLLPIDAAAVRVRRKLAALLAAEPSLSV